MYFISSKYRVNCTQEKVQAKAIDIPGGDNKSFCHKQNNIICFV